MEFVRIADKKRVDFITRAISQSAPNGSAVLDIGCGNGIISKAIASLGYKVTAVDISEKTILLARQVNPHPNIEYKVVAAGKLSPSPSSYQAIVCSEVLEHLHDPSSLLQIIHQSLTDNGICVVTVPNGFGPREMLITKPVQYIHKKKTLSNLLNKIKRLMGYSGTTVQSSADDLSHVQFFTHNALKKMAASTNFRIEAISKSNFVEQVFPFSLIARKNLTLQRWDCSLADRLPIAFTSGFMMVWKKI
jgi:2-polyprenyl-3-methyl-5-hydroxy-6-metoxy-1,4-benzoquinol methylase